MAISAVDTKILWGRAGGRCSNPQCNNDLTNTIEELSSYTVGEMAHIIARSANGPRGTDTGGVDAYENLILLCPTCHTHIDRAPEGAYTAEMLHAWKNDHERKIREAGKERSFESVDELKREVGSLLAENCSIFRQFGPQSEIALSDPGSNVHEIWSLRKIDTIVPNNRKIVNLIESNRDIVTSSDYQVFIEFKLHSQAFESHQYSRVDSYPLFPDVFREVFGG